MENCADENGLARKIGNWENVESEGITGVAPEEDHGGQKPIKVADPKLPTQAEMDEHNLTIYLLEIGADIASEVKGVRRIIG